MNWKAYKVVLGLQSPMHMGQARLGNLQTTRPYVHGKALWGALTARITRDNPEFGNDYREVGRRVNQEMAFSYFYPTNGDEVKLWPWDNPELFAWRFLGSYAGTALNYSQNSAADGMLHEVEFIAPVARDGKPVKLVGYLFEKEGCSLPWRAALSRLQVGGERTYGWGRLQVEQNSSESAFFNGYVLDLTGARPAVSLPKDAPLLAHTRAYGEPAVAAWGRVVPLVGRETETANAHGRQISTAVVCWEPGSQIAEARALQIGANGVWASRL